MTTGHDRPMVCAGLFYPLDPKAAGWPAQIDGHVVGTASSRGISDGPAHAAQMAAALSWATQAEGITMADGESSQPTTINLGRRRAAGIYGAIITAAILDTAGGHVSTDALVVSVVVTLLVYWLAGGSTAEVYRRASPRRSAAKQGIHLGSAGRHLADGHRILRAAARSGAGPAGRGFCLLRLPMSA